MRADIPTAQQSLTPAAASVVHKAIDQAKRKGHGTVQPLHVAAILLLDSPPGSLFHTACLQSLKDPDNTLRNALDLCFKVALERLPANATEPPIMSNALMAALKRAQANQRRGTPEQSLQPLLAVKVEMDQLIISILDDPSVSRVFKEAGFMSTEVKNNMEDALLAQASLAGPPTLENRSFLRRVSPFCPSVVDSSLFRQSLYSSPSAFAAVEPSNHEITLERGKVTNFVNAQPERQSPAYRGCSLTRPDADAAGHSPAQFRENAALQQTRLFSTQNRLLDSPFRSVQGGPNEHIARILETLCSSSKKRNPVLVSDSNLLSVSNFVMKEFTCRLMKGNVPTLLQGVQIIDLPVTSLSVGFLRQEDVVQKLAKLRSEVDGCMPEGAIIWVGDLQWLAETPGQTHSHLVVEELQQMMCSQNCSRIWLLASATTETFHRCQVDPGHALEFQLGLQSVVVTADSAGSAHQTRHGCYQSKSNGEMFLASQLGYGKPAAVKHFGSESDLCLDCTRNFQRECSILVKEEQTTAPPPGSTPGGSGNESSVNGLLPLKPHPQLPWLSNQIVGNRAPSPVKEEKSLLPEKLTDLLQKWLQKCSSHHLQPVSMTSGSSGSIRDHSSSPVSEVASSDERSSRVFHSLLNQASWTTQPVKSGKSVELSPHYSRMAKGNMPISLAGPNLVCSPCSREPANVKRGEESGIQASWMMNREGDASPAFSLKPRMLVGRAGNIRTDLALGRVNGKPAPAFPSRDLREEGQQPLPGRWQQSSTEKSCKTLSALGSNRRHVESLHELCWKLGDLVPWQKEAVAAVASAVMKCRSGEGGRREKSCGTWLMLLGPDRVGKRAVAKALAKLVYGSEEHLIHATASGSLASDSPSGGFRGKSPLDRLAETVARKPSSVVLLEDVDRADAVVTRKLSRAMDKGRLMDSNSKEVSFANVVVVMTCHAGANLLTNDGEVQGKRPIDLNEEKLSRLCPRGIRLLIGNMRSEDEHVLIRKGLGLSVVESTIKDGRASPDSGPADCIKLFGSPMSCKRKADGSMHDVDKRCRKEVSLAGRGFSLDLNLPVEESLSEDEPCVTEELSETREPETVEQLVAKVVDCARGSVPRDLWGLLDATVVFKPFDLNGLKDFVLEKLERRLQDAIPTSRAHVEIDRALLEVMVCFAWHTFSHTQEVENWMDKVLMRTLLGVLEMSSLSPASVLKLNVVERDAMSRDFAVTSSSLAGATLLPAEIQVCQ